MPCAVFPAFEVSAAEGELPLTTLLDVLELVGFRAKVVPHIVGDVRELAVMRGIAAIETADVG